MNENETTTGWTVTMRKYGATWYYETGNPQGGSFGSNLCGSQRAALQRALRNVPDGAAYQLTINEKDRGTFINEPGERMTPASRREI